MKNCLFILLFFFNIYSKAQPHFKYSAVDKQQLKKANSQFYKIHNLTTNQAYKLGLVYEKLYNKYRDTSMLYALDCFKYSSCFDAHCEKTIYKTINYKLARIYETGKGISSDTLKAMYYYMSSTKAGINHLATLRQKHCNQKKHYSLGITNFNFSDSLDNSLKKMLLGGVEISIPFFIACPCDSAHLNQIMFPIVSLLKDNPQKGLELFTGKSEIYGDMVGRIADYIHKQGINGNRIIVDTESRDYHTDYGNYDIKLVLLSNEEAVIEKERINPTIRKNKAY